jgi:predicted nuclease of predicted toxin-antitoxin system
LKLLLDFNLSPKLIPLLAELFPGSEHLKALGFDGETKDREIWRYARENGFALLTSDRDFLDISERLGHPPKVVRLEKMNYRTRVALELLRRNAIRIAEFGMSEQPVFILKNPHDR